MAFNQAEKLFGDCKYIPVVVIKKIEDAESTLAALSRADIPVAEITFRTDCAAEAIRIGTEKFPDMLIGAGTVMNAKQAVAAIEAGARFIVSPGLSADVCEACRATDIPYVPGCVTPTEIMRALELGINVVKFFPASVYGGLGAIKALSAAFPQVKFVPTGGVGRKNLDEYLAFEKVVAVGGSFFVDEALKKS